MKELIHIIISVLYQYLFEPIQQLDNYIRKRIIKKCIQGCENCWAWRCGGRIGTPPHRWLKKKNMRK